jgi:hypothetical protein
MCKWDFFFKETMIHLTTTSLYTKVLMCDIKSNWGAFIL